MDMASKLFTFTVTAVEACGTASGPAGLNDPPRVLAAGFCAGVCCARESQQHPLSAIAVHTSTFYASPRACSHTCGPVVGGRDKSRPLLRKVLGSIPRAPLGFEPNCT